MMITNVSVHRQHAEELKRRSLTGGRMRGGGDGRSGKRRRAGTVQHCDYLVKKTMSINRRRIDPVITLSTIFEEIVSQMRDMPDAQPFIAPVNVKVSLPPPPPPLPTPLPQPLHIIN